MNSAKILWQLPAIFLLAGCAALFENPSPFGYPPRGTSGAQSTSSTTSSSQISLYAWEKAMQGMMIGGAIAGTYGAGGGLIIGFLAGLFTADSHYTQQANRVQTEQAKDKQLEAQIEQELELQRQLENQIANSGAPAATPNNNVGQPSGTQLPQNSPPSTAARPLENTQVAAITKPLISKSPPPFKNVEVRDINGDGIPDLWIYYNPTKPGEIVRQEEASKGDGRVDTWSYFNSGQMIRRDVDSKGLGRPDLVYYYDQEKLVREERDENGQGRMTYRANYENGRLAKVEKDTAGAGRADQWIYYDTKQEGEIVVKEERDLNGDGIVDLWAYYENGRLVRRDVSAVGMELLSKHDPSKAFPTGHKQGLGPTAPPIARRSFSAR